jgi:hypothetical protein
VLRATFGTVHWPLLVAASLALLAVRPFPTNFLSYAARAEPLARRFLELSGRLTPSGRSAMGPVESELARLHETFKSLDCPDAASAYHWAVSEAMRLDLEAFALGGSWEAALRGREADRYWRRASDEARLFTAA